jgi:hypothetical protein
MFTASRTFFQQKQHNHESDAQKISDRRKYAGCRCARRRPVRICELTTLEPRAKRLCGGLLSRLEG